MYVYVCVRLYVRIYACIIRSGSGAWVHVYIFPRIDRQKCLIMLLALNDYFSVLTDKSVIILLLTSYGMVPKIRFMSNKIKTEQVHVLSDARWMGEADGRVTLNFCLLVSFLVCVSMCPTKSLAHEGKQYNIYF